MNCEERIRLYDEKVKEAIQNGQKGLEQYLHVARMAWVATPGMLLHKGEYLDGILHGLMMAGSITLETVHEYNDLLDEEIEGGIREP